MRYFLFSLLLTTFFQAKAQDTIYGKTIFSDIEFDTRRLLYSSNCAHGHICCDVGCHCCTELNRQQVYDTIKYPFIDSIQRIAIIERYGIANFHGSSPVQFIFKDKKGSTLNRYYRADLGYFYMFQDEIGFNRYPSSMEKEYQEKNAVLVKDTNGTFLRIDLKGQVLPMVFQNHEEISEGLFASWILINEEAYFALTNAEGKQLTPLRYMMISPFNEDGLAIIDETFGRKGLINKKGEIVLATDYQQLTDLGMDRYLSVKGHQKSIINSSGKVINDKGYEHYGQYSEGLVSCKKKPNIWVYLDINGKEKFTVHAEWVKDFSDGMAAVFKDKKYGFIDVKGDLVIDYQFLHVENFHDGVAPVSVGINSNTDKWGLINKKGNFINNEKYNEISRFKDGIARTQINGKGNGLINTKGREIMPCQYLFDAYGTSDSWLINGTLIRCTLNKPNSYELVDIEGKQLLDLSMYKSACFIQPINSTSPYSQYIRVYGENNNSSLINWKGELILPEYYKYVQFLSPEIAAINDSKSVRIARIDTGVNLIEISPNTHYQFTHNLIKVETTNQYGRYEYYDLNGKKIEIYGR